MFHQSRTFYVSREAKRPHHASQNQHHGDFFDDHSIEKINVNTN
uniref:Uncharacterized protein n=1 Tax=Loigolactobacillus rennini TaxID=238013 RepID=A0A1K2I3Y6_9LACO|nr:hypothetical protein LREN565_0066 [Loigolactobacillus rennini]